jgi:hypothetical protein
MISLIRRDRKVMVRHIRNIFLMKKLDRKSTIAANEGERQRTKWTGLSTSIRRRESFWQ